jgi:hypothetical protein
MANDITGNPWKLDTAGVIANWQVRIKNLVWVNATTGNTVLLQDKAGRDVLRAVYNEQGDNNFGEFLWVEGLNLVTIGGGELLLVIHK